MASPGGAWAVWCVCRIFLYGVVDLLQPESSFGNICMRRCIIETLVIYLYGFPPFHACTDVPV